MLQLKPSKGDWCKQKQKEIRTSEQKCVQREMTRSLKMSVKTNAGSSVTKLGDFFTLGNNSKPGATIILPKYPTFWGNFCKGVKIYHFSSKIILGNFYRLLAIFIWSHWLEVTLLSNNKRGQDLMRRLQGKEKASEDG